MSSFDRRNEIEARHNARVRALVAQFAPPPGSTVEQFAANGFAFEDAWQEAVLTYLTEREEAIQQAAAQVAGLDGNWLDSAVFA